MTFAGTRIPRSHPGRAGEDTAAPITRESAEKDERQMTKEDTYDEQISPLMGQVIAICKEHDIPMVASFQLDDDRREQEDLHCTTAILPEDSSDALKRGLREIRRSPAFVATMTMQAHGGSK